MSQFEPVIASSNTDLAAVLLFFGCKLPRLNPALISEVYKWSELKRGIKNPEKKAIWKFKESDTAFAIAQAFEDESAHEKFDSYLDALSLGDGEKKELKARHSASVSRAGFEICAWRKHLLKELAKAPAEVAWIVVTWDSGKIKAMVPKAASVEVKAKILEKDQNEY